MRRACRPSRCRSALLSRSLGGPPVADGELDGSAADAEQGGDQRPGPTRPVDVEGVVEAVLTWAECGDGPRDERDRCRVLPALLDDEEPVEAVHGPDRDDHHPDHACGGEW